MAAKASQTHKATTEASSMPGIDYSTRAFLESLQGQEIPAEGTGGEGGALLRETLLKARVLYNTLYARQPVGDQG